MIYQTTENNVRVLGASAFVIQPSENLNIKDGLSSKIRVVSGMASDRW